jgi:hypothetical protein
VLAAEEGVLEELRGRHGGGRHHGDGFGYMGDGGGFGFHGDGAGYGFNGDGFGPYPPAFVPGWGWQPPRGFGRGRSNGRGRSRLGGRYGVSRGTPHFSGPLHQPGNQEQQVPVAAVHGASVAMKGKQDEKGETSTAAVETCIVKLDEKASSTPAGKVSVSESKVPAVEDSKIVSYNQGSGSVPMDVKMSKKNCYRCSEKGHLIDHCEADVLCDICDSTDHNAFRCPVHDEPKPVAQSVGYAVDALGAYYIEHPPIQPTKKSARTALVTVSGGFLSEDDLVSHLKFLVRQNFSWEVQCIKENVYKVPFPNRTELLRQTYLVSANLPNGISLKFEEFFEEEDNFGYPLPVVWMRVLNLPAILRKYKVLWALGTMFGVTQKVDMKTTKVNTFGQFCVAVLEPECVPNAMDVIIGNRFFELKFEVEPFAPNSGISGLSSKDDNNENNNEDLPEKDVHMSDASNADPSAYGTSSMGNNQGSSSKEGLNDEQRDVDWGK